ncbi:RNA polymerase sigma factor [Streptomyces sp. NRRL WC-3742]|uniref:RNA polymerase sigma factor n=1 Tax=Streptomyces sp. NRRL WC-3742 TaxID=1463934 RepID=UPI00068C5FE1|nr:sigma-70 family RNA polymerase sigma factor [Streptomyces sp. NRRL WC-3742]
MTRVNDGARETGTLLAETVRLEGARILATLVRTVGDLRLAEDAVQEATISALRDWPVHGVPDSPRAWITTTARHKAIDLLRRERLRTGKEREGVELMELRAPDPPPESRVRDDQLRLIFTCCHPALEPVSRIALALRTLCGLSTAQIAAVLLTTEAATAKRLTRVRQKIARAKIPYRTPDEAELPVRLTAVCGVVHALYTTGHTAIAGRDLVDVDMCLEAVRLARLLTALLPDEPQPQALLALLLFSEARRAARLTADGRVVLLADQDRGRWDRQAEAEALALLNRSLHRTEAIADPYQLQAAIAAQHAIAPTAADTDWREIVRLYGLLLQVQPTPAAALGHAVAVAEDRGPEAGLAELDAIAEQDHRWWAIRAELLARTGRFEAATAAMRRSLDATLPEPERVHRISRITRWADMD